MRRFLAKCSIYFVALLGFLLLYVPLFTIIVLSFIQKENGNIFFGTGWYEKLFSNVALKGALWQSLSVAFASAAAATCIGTLGAYALERSDFPGKRFLDILTLAPFILPEMVMGLALLIWFALLQVTLGWWSMTLAHVTFGVSYVVMVVRARLKNFDPSLEDAARDLGANRYQVFFKINLPLNIPAIISGFLMSFILSFDDFIIAFFTTGVGSDTLPLKLYSLIKLGFDPQVYALSSLILVFTLVCVVTLSRMGRGIQLFNKG